MNKIYKILISCIILSVIIQTSSAESEQLANTVKIVDINGIPSFSPASITIQKGATVTWTNDDTFRTHTVTSDTGIFNSGFLSPGQTFRFTFNNIGTFNYHCNIHTFMHGRITVVSSMSSITVASPNGGESWIRGTTKTIIWSHTGNPGSNVKIELLKGGILNRVISSSTPNDGSFSWVIPIGQTLGTDYKIRITSTSNPTFTDTSNNNFIIAGINVNIPNGGENWIRGTTKIISWSSVGNAGPFVKIELFKGGILNRVISSNTPNDGSFSWAIPIGQTLGTDYKIRITSISNPAYTDISNNNFIIAGINVNSPNGGENWQHGTIKMITWSSTGNAGSFVKIELLKGGILNRVISSNTPNDGSFSWTILSTQTLGTDYKMRITSTSNPAYTDNSNNNFRIL